jgi:hypothetical protein
VLVEDDEEDVVPGSCAEACKIVVVKDTSARPALKKNAEDGIARCLNE